jgi:hypothetical protein
LPFRPRAGYVQDGNSLSVRDERTRP